jgi:hypothetical protein
MVDSITPGIEGILDMIHTTFNKVNGIATKIISNLNVGSNELISLQKKLDLIKTFVENAERDPTNLVREHHPKIILQNQDDIQMTKKYAIQEEQIMTNKILMLIGLMITLGILIIQHSNVLLS